MTTRAGVGSVAALWRFPVKSMQGERLDAAEVDRGGVVGDRTHALLDTETGKVVCAKSLRLFPGVLECRAALAARPGAGDGPARVRIELPDGRSLAAGEGDLDAELSAHFGRGVRLLDSAPADFTIDQYVPDIAGADAAGRRDVMTSQKLGAALYAELGVDSPVPAGSFFDLFPISVITTSTLASLGALAPESRFDERRFRMNLVLDTPAPGFPENEWVGRALAIGERVRLRVTLLDPRCVMTTVAQGDLPRDAGVLRALVEHNRLQLGEWGSYPCAGVYAVVERAGRVRVGDAVTIE